MFENFKLSDFKFDNDLGKGRHGHVYKVTYKNNYLALKIIKEDVNDDEQNKKLYREYNIMKNLNHPNIEKVYGQFKDYFQYFGQNCYFFVLELINGCNLKEYLDSYEKMNTNIGQQTIIKILDGIVNGLECLHNKGIMHRDISLENIMLTKNDEIKITDFGISAYLNNQNYSSNIMVSEQTIVGRNEYASPEIYNAYLIYIRTGKKFDNIYNTKTDIYSLGVVMFKLMTFYFPSQLRQRNLNKEKYADKIDPGKYDQELINLVMSMLQEDPEKRPSCEQIKNTLSFIKDQFENRNGLNAKYSAFSSVMKCFSHTEEIYNYLINNSRNKKKVTDNKNNSNIYSLLSSFMFELENSKEKEKLNDEYILTFVKEISNKILIFGEEKYLFPKTIIQTFFDYFLLTMPSIFSYNNTKGHKLYENNIDNEENFFINNKIELFKNCYKNIFVNTFYFLILKEYICPGCKSLIKKDLDIQYDIEFQDKGIISELLNNYLENNIYSNYGLNSMPCKKCGILFGTILEKKRLYLAPEVLIFHFNSYVPLEEYLQIIESSKNDSLLYSLKSIILSYKGKNNKEKYATAIKNNENWIFYTDNEKFSLSLEEIQNKGTIHTVFYKKISQ